MCLNFSHSLTEQYKRKNRNRKWITVYKAVRIDEQGSLKTSIQNESIQNGWYESNRNQVDLEMYEKSTGTINYGIHVLLNKRVASKYYNNGLILLKCKAKISDFVAIEDPNANMSCREAVFMKIWIPAEEIRKAKLAGRK